MKLTDAAVRRLAAPDPNGRQKLHWADDPKGFGVLCSGVSNAKTFVLQRAINGKTRRVTIAPVLGLTGELEAARAKAQLKLADFFYKNIDPKDRSADTLRDALEVYISSRNLRPRSAEGYRLAVEKHLTSWLDKPLRDITPSMVLDRHAEIAERHKANANGVMRVLRAIYNHASYLSDDTLPPNPVRLRGAWHKLTPRTGHVAAADLPAFYQATNSLESPIGRDLILLLLFTGLRRREATALRWEHVDFSERVIRLPATMTKAKRRLDLPMSDIVHGVLVTRRAAGDARWVFPANSRSGHVEEPRYYLEQVAAATGIAVSVHDLRRTFVTVAESTEMSVLALRALVNHSLANSGVTGDYVQIAVERLRGPAQRVADELKRLCDIAPPAGVLALKS